MGQKYTRELTAFLSATENFHEKGHYEHSREALFEALMDWSIFHTLDEVKSWFHERRRNRIMQVKEISLNQMDQWKIDEKTGNIEHCSREFFRVHGLRITTKSRERMSGWDQPILQQIDYDGGIVGLIRKRFSGIPHYLCEAKEEPGNYGVVQISPTIQATFSNIKCSHGGRKPHFTDTFLDRHKDKDITVLFDSWLAEDGGRFYLKRNRGVLLEASCQTDIQIPNDNFIWLSLFQIKQLLIEDAWINPHLRGIISHV